MNSPHGETTNEAAGGSLNTVEPLTQPIALGKVIVSATSLPSWVLADANTLFFTRTFR